MNKRRRNRKAAKWPLLAAALVSAAALAAVYEKFLPPIRKPDRKHYPYGLVLGCAAHDDGTPTRAQLGRCELAIEAWRKGDYDTLIISGSNVKNQYVEAQIMKELIHNIEPDLPIYTEEKARNTWENLKYTRQMIGDAPLEVITGALHARRASAITKNFFSDYAVIGYPDFTWKKFFREIISRIQYCAIEIQKKL